MRPRVLGVLASTALVAAGLPVLASAPAQALEGGVAFTATPLPTYQTDGIAWAVASAQGKVFVGGSFSNVRPPNKPDRTSGGPAVGRSNFVVLDAATGEPTSCQPAALLSTAEAATVRSLAVSHDGQTLYIGGSFSTFGGLNRGNMAALDIASCTVVSGWSPNPTATVRAIAVAPDDGTVYFGGQFLSVSSGTVARQHAAAAIAVGKPGAGTITAWAPPTYSTPATATVNNPDVRAIAIKPDGSEVLLGGDFEQVNGVASHALAAVDPTTGANLWTLNPPNVPWPATNDSMGYSSNVKSIVATASGFYTGNEGTGQGSFDGRTAWSWDHTLLWKNGCLGATQSLVVYSNVLYSASHAHNCSFVNAFPDGARHHLLAETLTADPTTAVDGNPPFPALLPFFPNTNDGDVTLFPRETVLEGIGPRAMAVAHTSGNGDLLYVVGEFSSVDGVPQQGITAFRQNANAAPSTPVMSVSSFTPGQARIAWLPSTDNDDANLDYTLERSTTGSSPWTMLTQPSQYATFWTRPQMTYVDSGLNAGSTYWYRVTVSDGTTSRTTTAKSVVITNVGEDLGGSTYGPSPYEKAVLADDPEMYLRYNETGDVFLSDRSTNRNNMIFKGAGSFGAGLVTSDASRALTMTGGAGQVAYSQKLMDSPSSYSLETWFSTTSTQGGKLIGFGNKQDYSSNTFDKMVWMTNSGQLAFGVYTNAQQRLISPASYNDGQRHHVVAVQDAALGMRLYVDGALVASNSVKTNQTFKGYWHVGGDNLVTWANSSPYTTSSYAFAGTLDETAIYLSPLTLAKVQNHYTLADSPGTEVVVLTPQKPTVSIGSPADGSTVKGVVPVSVFGATTTATTSHPMTLQLVVDGTPSATYSYTCPDAAAYTCSNSFSWDTGALSLGSHTLAAKITSTGPSDNATSAPITVTVAASAPPQAPSVSISAPAANAIVGPGTVDVHASASTVTGTVSYPSSLDLIVDGKTSSPITSIPCSGTTYDCAGVLTWDLTGFAGVHTLQVRANATSECTAVPASCSSLSSAVTVKVVSATTTVITPLKTVRGRTTVYVKGRVTVSLTGAPAVGVPVKVTATPAIGTPSARGVTTDANGYYSVPFSVAMNTVFTAAAQPSSWYLGSTRAARQYVAGIPSCRLSATTVRSGARDVLTCKLSGLPSRTPVTLQYLVSGRWRTLVTTTSRSGVAYISFTIRTRGYWYVRPVIASNKVYYLSVGAAVRVRIV